MEDKIKILIKALAMTAENMQRQALKESMAYSEQDFLSLLKTDKKCKSYVENGEVYNCTCGECF